MSGYSAALHAVLSRLGDAPAIACLAGEQGATIAWAATVDTVFPASSWSHAPHAMMDGRTWGTVPVAAAFIQLDYEWPAEPACVLRGGHRVRIDQVGDLHGDVAALQARPLRSMPPPRLLRAPMPVWNAHEHTAKVTAIRTHIAAGDCYQVNLAVPFVGALANEPAADLALFAALWARSPAPFAGFFRRPGRASVISHSPECFLAAQSGRVVSVPIKGTRRRQGDAAATRRELLASEKDAAELTMIVDLVRHDLGRIAEPGSVVVEDAALLLDLPYVHHRAARIACRPRAGTTLADLLAATYPAGSITGAPKHLVQRLIREQEGAARGAAYGAFGWAGAEGCELAVAIRTATLDRASGALTIHAGGGIVADSDPVAEWDEVHAKAAGLLSAFEDPI
jgi:para-aminobenzoate synthetase component I